MVEVYTGRYLKMQGTPFTTHTFGTQVALHKPSLKSRDVAALCHRWEVLLFFLHPVDDKLMIDSNFH